MTMFTDHAGLAPRTKFNTELPARLGALSYAIWALLHLLAAWGVY